MANLKSSKKSIRKDVKRTIRNKHVVSTLKHHMKQTRNSASTSELNVLYKKADAAFAKGKIHKNKANRIKSRLAKAANKNAKNK
ncbi:MAG: 30S ribosomal protein S20 [Mycoplasmataceae bacterium]|jgi:small subunit ribosomal protein S20|nr:30S ribosomal protein S20 [Mycoplasmataceae bacterium]